MTRNWGLDVIQEESDSDYYRSLDYCKVVLNNRVDRSSDDYDTIVQNCEGYLDGNSPKLYPKTITDKIYNFKKDYSNHSYANVNFDTDVDKFDAIDKSNIKPDKNINIDSRDVNIDKSNISIDKLSDISIDFDRRNKNDVLRKQFFLSDNIDKNDINDQFNRFNGKKIECHSIINDVTKSGPDVRVSGSLNMKLFNPERYNRVLTTTETFMETAEASFTKNQISKLKNDGFENFIKKSERYYTSETRDRNTDVSSTQNKGKTEIRIVYNPTFKCTGENIKGFCQYCKRKCPRTEQKCCPKCVCLEIELQIAFKDNWLNILCLLSIFFMLVALFIQWLMPSDPCVSEGADEKCFEMM